MSRILPDLIKIENQYKSRINKLDELIAKGDPNSNILQCHIDFSKFLEKTKDSERCTDESIKFMHDLQDRKEYWEKKKKEEYSTDKFYDEKHELIFKLQELQTLLFTIKLKTS